jgi:hypothetical protein
VFGNNVKCIKYDDVSGPVGTIMGWGATRVINSFIDVSLIL